MISTNLTELVRRMASAERSLDVGGWTTQMNSATHVVDHFPYESRRPVVHDPEKPQRFTKDTWLQLDINQREPWPFPDKHFDFAMCSHVLEDIRDPIWVLSELTRVARAGYIETPRPAYEVLAGQKWLRPGKPGAPHHRWFVEFLPASRTVEFRFKPHDLLERGLVLRYWTALYDHRWEAFAQGMFWEGDLKGVEIPYHVDTAYEYIRGLLPEARNLRFFAPASRVSGIIRRALVRGPQQRQS
jgi:hypothetical protein